MYTQDIAFAQGHTKKNRDVFHACLVYWVCMYILLLLYLYVEGVCVGCVCACALCVRACVRVRVCVKIILDLYSQGACVGSSGQFVYGAASVSLDQ